MKHVRNCNSGLMGYRQLRRDPRHRLTRALQHESHRQQLLLTLQQHAVALTHGTRRGRG